jgi:hypothetical protein
VKDKMHEWPAIYVGTSWGLVLVRAAPPAKNMTPQVPTCQHRNSHAVDIDGIGEQLRFCHDCGENFELPDIAPSKASKVLSKGGTS